MYNVKEDNTGASKNTTNEVGAELQMAANRAGRKVRDIYNAASDEITNASEQVHDEIRANPIRSVAIALGLGVVLGALVRR